MSPTGRGRRPCEHSWGHLGIAGNGGRKGQVTRLSCTAAWPRHERTVSWWPEADFVETSGRKHRHSVVILETFADLPLSV